MTTTPPPKTPIQLIADVLDAAAEALRRGDLDPTTVPDRADVPTMGGTKLLVSVAEAAELLSVSRSTVYELVAAGVIASVKLGRRRLVPTEELRARVSGWCDQTTTA